MSSERHVPRLVFRPRPPRGSRADQARLAAAREKAQEYRNSETDPNRDPNADSTAQQERKPSGVREMEAWSDLVSQRIEEAIRRGDFDNLRGHGQPLRNDANPFVPPDQQMAFKLLQNNDLTPDWIAERREVLRMVEQWRSTLQRIVGEAQVAWAAAQTDERHFQLEQTWARWVARWESEVVEINRRINNLNLKQPVLHLEVFKLRLDDELRRAGAARKLTH